MWSGKAHRSRTILLGKHKQRPAQPTPKAQIIDAPILFSGGGATESTQWFEVGVRSSSTTSVVIVATITTVQICPATVGTQLFHEVTIKGTEKTSYPGAPRLPVIPLIVAVDHEREVILSIEATGATVEDDVRVIPSQQLNEPISLLANAFTLDEEIYNYDEYYPDTTAVISSPVIHRGIRCVHLKIFPIQCNPTISTVRMYQTITATITYGTISTVNTLESAPENVDAMVVGILEEAIINFESLDLQSTLPEGTRLLAIIAQDYWNNGALHNLLDWHDYEGLKTKRIIAEREFNVTTSSIALAQRDLRHKQRDWIRQEIMDEYSTTDPYTGQNSLLFVLLVGDVDVLPDGDIISQGPSSTGTVIADGSFLSWFDWDDKEYGYYDYLGPRWYQGDAGYSFQLDGNSGIDVLVSRITGQLDGTSEVTRVANHSLGYATYQNNDVTASEGWPTTDYASDPKPASGYHWSSKVNVVGFKYDSLCGGRNLYYNDPNNSAYHWRFVCFSHRLWDMINTLPGSPADVTLINGEFESEPTLFGVPYGNDALLDGRDSLDMYPYYYRSFEDGRTVSSIMCRRVNGWSDGLGVMFFQAHGQKCMFPCWNKLDSPQKDDCIYCLQSFVEKLGLDWGCPCATGSTTRMDCTFLCGEDLTVDHIASLENTYKTPVVIAFSCLTTALKQVGSIDENDGWWGLHWTDLGAWNYPAEDAECDCQEHYAIDGCYSKSDDEDAYIDREDVHGCPISEEAVNLGDQVGGALAWFGTAGVYGQTMPTLLMHKMVEAIWPSAQNQHYQPRLGAITWSAMMTMAGEFPKTSGVSQNDFDKVTRQMMWIGDSALDIRTKYPSYLYITPDPEHLYKVIAQPLDEGEEFTVFMGEDVVYDKDKKYDPAAFALVTFAHGERAPDGKNWDWEKYWVGMTDASGKVWMPGLTIVNPDLLRVVATRHNCRPALFWIDLSP